MGSGTPEENEFGTVLFFCSIRQGMCTRDECNLSLRHAERGSMTG